MKNLEPTNVLVQCPASKDLHFQAQRAPLVISFAPPPTAEPNAWLTPKVFIWLTVIAVTLMHLALQAQTLQFVSEADQSISAEAWGLIPLRDNVNQIYSRPLIEHLDKLMQERTHFIYRGRTSGYAETGWLPPQEVRIRYQSLGVQALVGGEIIRGPSGVLARIDLYLGTDGELFSSESSINQDEGIEALKKQVTDLLDRVLSRIPYEGVLTSRRGEMVTLNVGRKHKLKSGDEVWVIQVVRLDRHPRDRFIVQSQVQTLGKVVLTQVDDSTSFGRILMERNPGLLKASDKVFFREPTIYKRSSQNTIMGPDSTAIPGEASQPDALPQLGRASLLFGFSGVEQSNTFATQGPVGGRDSLAPTIKAGGELWLTENWFIGGDLAQFMGKIPNNLPGSTPGELPTQIFSSKLLGGGQLFLSDVTPDRPLHQTAKLQLYAGLEMTQIRVANSTPPALTSFSHGGIFLGVSGQVPWGDVFPKAFVTGAYFHFYISPTTTESPIKSGSAKPNFLGLSVFGDYYLRPGLALRGEFNLQQYNIAMSGTGARSEPVSAASQHLESVLGGVSFYF